MLNDRTNSGDNRAGRLTRKGSTNRLVLVPFRKGLAFELDLIVAWPSPGGAALERAD